MKRVKVDGTWYEKKDFKVLSSGAILVGPLKIAFWKDQLNDYEEDKIDEHIKETLQELNPTKRVTKEEAFKMLQNKKVYVGGFTQEVQRKLFEIGYEWVNNGCELLSHQFIITLTAYQTKGGLMTVPNIQEFMERKEEEITLSSILNLDIEPEFKNGDFIYWKTDCDSGITIVRNQEKGRINHHVNLNIPSKNLNFDMYIGNARPFIEFRLASESEMLELKEKLNEINKRWNKGRLQIEDILHVEDLCIFWDIEKSEAIISTLLEIYPENGDSKHYKCINKHWYHNAIKCNSLEQYLNFTKEDQKTTL